ncbi:Smt3-specific protease [Coelomomyces lativittatus]|nr:Smt3-specific protease [Coelomomyces lativittatus]
MHPLPTCLYPIAPVFPSTPPSPPVPFSFSLPTSPDLSSSHLTTTFHQHERWLDAHLTSLLHVAPTSTSDSSSSSSSFSSSSTTPSTELFLDPPTPATPWRFPQPKLPEDVLRKILHTPRIVLPTLTLQASDLRLLTGPYWLNDEVINGYGGLLQHESDRPWKSVRMVFYSSFFYTQCAQFGYDRVKRWSKKIQPNVFHSIEWLVFPIHQPHHQHWCAGAIDFLRHRILYFDSLHGSPGPFFSVIRKYLAMEAQCKGVHMDFKKWEDVYQPVR